MDCSIVGSTLANMPIKSGGWRLGNDTATVYECFNLAACTSADGPSANATVSSRRQLVGSSDQAAETFGDALCALGHTGFLCGACKANFHGYSDATLCEECAGDIGLAFAPAIALVTVLVIALIVYCRRGSIGVSIEDIEAVAEGGVQGALEGKLDEQVAEAEDGAAATGRLGKGMSAVLRAIGRLQKFSVKFKILLSL